MSEFSKDEIRQLTREWMDAFTAIQEEDNVKAPLRWRWHFIAHSVYTMHALNLAIALLLALILWRVW